LKQGLLLLLLLLQPLLQLLQLLRQLCLMLLLLQVLHECFLLFHDLATQLRRLPSLIPSVQLFLNCTCKLNQRIARALYCGICSYSPLRRFALPAAAAAAVAAAARQYLALRR
jgi:hypothetical protein